MKGVALTSKVKLNGEQQIHPRLPGPRMRQDPFRKIREDEHE